MVDANILKRRPDETPDDYLWRLGSLKEAGIIESGWAQLALFLNTYCGEAFDESTWRKRYNRLVMLQNASELASQTTLADNNFSVEEKMNSLDDLMAPKPQIDPAAGDTDGDDKLLEIQQKLEQQKELVQVRDERYAIGRLVRAGGRADALMDLFKTEIHRYDAKPAPKSKAIGENKDRKVVYALLSDIHYGIAFESSAGVYNSDIARERVMTYAEKIITIGKGSGADVCYVSLLGDMISGIIHAPIRIENRENAVQQVIGVSELVSDFLYRLSEGFTWVYVNSVSGNHSRLDMIAENSLRAEKLDALIPWYCKSKLENVLNVAFMENEIDPTVCDFNICGKYFMGVHGDMDKDLSKSATRIERLCGHPVDYMIAGHLHVPNMLMEDRGYIRNGSVCGSGDDYTMRNRLFGNPSQVCMTVTTDGVESVWPILL